MNALQTELAHLVRISSTPAWEEYATWKAKQYARQFPEYAELPRLLKEAMQSTTSAAAPSTAGT